MVTRKLLAAAIVAASCLLGATSGWAMLAPGAPDVIQQDGGPDGPISSNFVLGGTTPGKWGPGGFGTGATVTWGLISTGVSCPGCGTFTTLSGFMPAGFLIQIENAFAAWSAVANITFAMVADDGAAFDAVTPSGDIRIGGHVFDGPDGILAHAFFPPVNGVSAAGDIHFDVADTWQIGFGGSGLDIFQVAAHEIGHAIGLGHTAVPSSLMNPFYTEDFSGLQADDILGGQFLYGAALIPEPEIYAMLAAGLGLIGWVARRRRPQLAAAA